MYHGSPCFGVWGGHRALTTQWEPFGWGWFQPLQPLQPRGLYGLHQLVVPTFQKSAALTETHRWTAGGAKQAAGTRHAFAVLAKQPGDFEQKSTGEWTDFDVV